MSKKLVFVLGIALLLPSLVQVDAYTPNYSNNKRHRKTYEDTSTTTPPVVIATTTSPVPVPVIPIPPVASSTQPVATSTGPVIITPVSTYGLNSNTTLNETGSMNEGSNPYWWLNSGGYFLVNSGIGKTSQGSLAQNDPWRLEYASTNPEDTDNGYHPQNIFRLVTKSTWKNLLQEAYFNVNAYNTSASSNRAEHNGFLFFNRYVNSDNLYYTGIRVDGHAIIKKKINGTYYTMAEEPVYPGTYNRTSNPNLIPTNASIGLRSMVVDNSNGSVSIKVYMDKNHTGNWELVAEAIDNGSTYGPIIDQKASAGIRTDFMDAEFSGYTITEL
jgi:hypothetical protein